MAELSLESIPRPSGCPFSGKTVAGYVAQLRENYEIARKQVEALNGERRLNLAYYLGEQWAEVDEFGQVVPSEVDLGENVRPVTNNIVRMLVDERLANVVGQFPQVEVVASTNEFRDLSKANLANKAAEAQWYRLKLTDFFALLLKTAWLKYNAYAKVYWDYTAGRIVTRNGKKEPEGDIQVALIQPTQVFPDPSGWRVSPESPQQGDCRWLFEMSVVDVGVVLNNPNWRRRKIERTLAGNWVLWGGVPDEQNIVPSPSIAGTEGEEAMLSTIGVDARAAAKGSSIHAEPEKNKFKGKLVRVLSYYEHPSAQFPAGRFAVFLPDNGFHVLEYREELPYATKDHPDGLFPWVMAVDVPCPGRLAGHCRVSDIRGIQDLINRTMTRWVELRNRILPWVLIDQQSIVSAEDLQHTGVAEILKYSSVAGEKPSVYFPPALSAEVATAVNEITFLIRQAEDKMNIHSPAYHPHREGTTLGEIEIVKLMDLAHLKSHDVRRAEETIYVPVIKLILRLMQRYYDEERTIRFFGSDGRAAVQSFRGSDIHVEDVFIVPGTSMPKSRGLEVSLALRAAQLGLFSSSDPQEARQLRQDLMDILRLHLTTETTPAQLDSANADEENLRLLSGEAVEVDEFDDHQIHIRRVMMLLKSRDFRNLPPEKKTRVRFLAIEHYAAHLAMLQQIASNPAVAMAMGMPVPPPPRIGGPAIPTGRGTQLVEQEIGGTPKSGNLVSGRKIPEGVLRAAGEEPSELSPEGEELA